jgi:hypothetical protein
MRISKNSYLGVTLIVTLLTVLLWAFVFPIVERNSTNTILFVLLSMTPVIYFCGWFFVFEKYEPLVLTVANFHGNQSLITISAVDIGWIKLSDKAIGQRAFLHADLASTAEYDIPHYLSGDERQLDLPIDKQRIVCLLADHTIECVAELKTDGSDVGCYYITVK